MADLEGGIALTRLPILPPQPPKSGGGAPPGRGHTSGIVSPELPLQLSNFPPNALAASKTTWSPSAGRSERVFGDTASLLDAGGRVPSRGCGGEPAGGQAFCHKRGSRADVEGVEQRIAAPRD